LNFQVPEKQLIVHRSRYDWKIPDVMQQQAPEVWILSQEKYRHVEPLPGKML